MGEASSFGEWLRHRRRELDLTQEDLGRQVGCARITIRKIEADQIRPSKQLAELFREHLGVPAEENESFIRFARGEYAVETITTKSPKHNLPHAVSSFIGREHEIVEILRLMNLSRLVTLMGAGGSGKTRLAIEVGRQVVDWFPEGVWFISFAALMDSALVPQTVAAVLRVRENPNCPLIESLVDYLHARKSLLIFDNCEHLIAECAKTVEKLLQACPQLSILVTSREVLNIPGEEQYYVPTLSLPDPREIASPEGLMRSEAVRLFVERAEAVRSDFALTVENAAAVVPICQHLDGIPLALELAAALVKGLRVEQIVARLNDRFHLLTEGSRTALPRQRTLQATIDWSYNLLSDEERAVLRRLSVFAGGWTLDAAEAVCAGEDIPSNTIMELQLHLIDKSLVVAEMEGTEPRYHMLETIRRYAQERLKESCEESRVRDLQLHDLMEWTERFESKLRGPEQIACWNRMEKEHDNIRSALDWSLRGGDAQEGLRLAAAAFWFWKLRGHWREGVRWLKDTLANPPNEQRTAARARALVGTSVIAQEIYTSDPLEQWYEEALGIWRELGDRWWLAFTLICRGWRCVFMNDAASSMTYFKESVAVARELQDDWLLGFALHGLGAATERFDYAEARLILEESLIHLRVAGDRWTLADGLKQLATVAEGQGNYAQAGSLNQEALGLFQELGDQEMETESMTLQAEIILLGQGDMQSARRLLEKSLTLAKRQGFGCMIGIGLAWCGCIVSLEGQTRRAAVLLAAGESVLNSMGTSLAMWPWVFSAYQQYVAGVKAQLGEAEFARASEEGQAMIVEQAVQYALEETKEG